MKRTRTETAEQPLEEHDSGFMIPMGMFKPFPHNDTFIDNRSIEIRASPQDNPTSETVTFLHHKQEYGVLNLQDAIISGKITVKQADGNNVAADQNVALHMLPLTQFWKSKSVLINNDQTNTVTTQENELNYVCHLLDKVPSQYQQSDVIDLAIHDTPGQFDDVTTLNNHDDDGTVNKGAARRYNQCHRGETTPLWCYDTIKLTGDTTRFVVSSFDIRVKLDRLEKNKCLFGTAAQCANAFIHIEELKLTIPAMKPHQQLTSAINQLMIQQGQECKYYVRQFRYVPTPVAQGVNKIILNDIFNGARPTRLIVYVRTQARYNGSYTLNPNRMILPLFDHFAVKINDAWLSPELKGSREAYIQLRRILNRRNDEMPFSYTDYLTDYGMIVTDLTENRDSYNRVLPNTTSGNVGLEMRLTANIAAPSQIICIGDFRNQLSVGYQSTARSKFTF
ncbi:Hypothetical predicted protein [Paramuricea clavata]|uniref:Uncharacterized protein n=1 Tax=Paramuricea clavata TaxID=317549 RepID=A0A6S7FRX1_PARCT|nr:Hypothetical predicted protein [Paramuricea clavata]